MSAPVMLLKVFPNHVSVSRSEGGLSKNMAIKDVISILCETAQGVFNFSRSERLRLPENVYLTEYAGDRLNLALYFKERPATVRHIERGEKENSYEIMMPNIVLHLVLRVLNNGAKHEVVSAHFYSTQVERDNLPTTIPGRLDGVFGYVPFPNFYDNFTMCLGHNSVISSVEGGDLRIFKMYYDVISGSPFNNDLGLHNVHRSYDNYSAWFKHLEKVYKTENRFPYEDISI